MSLERFYHSQKIKMEIFPNEFLICDLDNECIYGTVRTDKSKEEVQKIINDVKKIESYSSWDLEERFDEESISYTNSCEKVYF